MDLTSKKKLLRQIPSGLYVIGVKSGDHWHAFTASWLVQASMEPPCVGIGVRKDSHALKMMRKDRAFSINYVRKENRDTVAHFFKAVHREGNKLGHYHFHTDITGAPILDESIGYLECRIKRIVSGFGDHATVIAEVVNAKLKEDVPPLLMADTPWHYGG